MGLRLLPNDYKIKFSGLDTQSDVLEVLVLGSSHAYYAIDPSLLDAPAYNAAFVSQSLDVDAAILRHYLPQMPRLHTVVAPVDYPILGFQLKRSVEDWRIKNYVLYTGVEVPHVFSDYSELLTSPLPINVGRLRWHYVTRAPFSTTLQPGGFGVKPTTATTNLAESGAIAARRHTNTDEEIYLAIDAALREMAAICAERGVRLLLIKTPQHDAYRSHLDARQLAELQRWIDDNVSALDNVIYHGLREPSLYGDGDFRDADHLNELGAAKFSRRLNDVLRGLSQ